MSGFGDETDEWAGTPHPPKEWVNIMHFLQRMHKIMGKVKENLKVVL
jgi:hypothetical protein